MAPADAITGTNSDKIDALLQQGARVEAQLATLDGRMSTFDERLRTLDERLRAVEVGVAQMSGTLSAWNRIWAVGVPIVAALIAFLTVKTFETTSRVDLAVARINDLSTQVAAIKDLQIDQGGRLARVEDRLGIQDLRPKKP